MGDKKEFAFFLGCIMPNRYPQIEAATRYLMEKMGYTLRDMEKAACCPAPGVLRSFNKFDWLVAGARNICIAEKMGIDIITVCNGCFGTLMDVNKHLKADEETRKKVNEKLKLLGDYEYKGTIKVRHIAEFLTLDLSQSDIEPYLVRKVDANVAIHYGCHYLKPTRIRQLTSAEEPRELEDFVEFLGATNVDFRNKLTCCGAGGGVKTAYADSSMTILEEKMNAIKEVKPDFILDICPFCHLQFETGQKWLNENRNTDFNIPVIHISQMLAYCMGMEQEKIGMKYQLIANDFKFKSKPIKEDS